MLRDINDRMRPTMHLIGVPKELEIMIQKEIRAEIVLELMKITNLWPSEFLAK